MKAVNLIPSGERRGAPVGAGRSGGAAYVVLGVVGVLAVFALLYGISRHKVSSQTTKLASINAQTARVQQTASELTPYTSFMSLREQRTQAVEQVVDSRFDWAHAFHELGRVMPHDASISSLDGSVGGSEAATATSSTPAAATTASTASASTASAAPSSATPPGSVPTVTLSGCAKNQAEVALTLQRLRLIDGVSDVSLQSSATSATASTGAGSAAASGNGRCTPGSPDFSVQITFDPLPTPSATSGSGTRLTSSTGGEK
jgi:Tfp pilus assembly protein PilN